MNTIQKTALKETVKTLVVLTAVGIAVPTAIFLLPTDVLAGIACVAMLGFGAKMIYNINLAKAEFDAKINKTVDQ